MNKFSVKILNDYLQIHTLERKCFLPLYFHKTTNSFDFHSISSHAKKHDVQQIWTTHMFTLLCFQMSQFYLPNLLFKNTTSNFSKVHFLSMLCFVVEKKYRIWKVCFRIIMGYFQSKIQPNSKFLSKKKPSDNSNLLKYSRNIMINCKSEKTGMLNKYFCCILQRQGCMPQDWWNTSLYWVRNMLASSFWSLTF